MYKTQSLKLLIIQYNQWVKIFFYGESSWDINIGSHLVITKTIGSCFIWEQMPYFLHDESYKFFWIWTFVSEYCLCLWSSLKFLFKYLYTWMSIFMCKMCHIVASVMAITGRCIELVMACPLEDNGWRYSWGICVCDGREL